MIGELISGGAQILSGMLSDSARAAQNEQNIRYQREFAQSGIGWRVNDALRSGVHPLFALGAQTTSFQPSAIGDSGLGRGIAGAGQDIGRAISAMETKNDRSVLTALQLERAGLENDLLRSQIARSNSGQLGPPMPSVGERYLIDGQSGTPSLAPPVGFGSNPPGSSALVTTNPQVREASAPGVPHQTPAAAPEVTFTRTSSGGYAPVPSKTVKESLEDMVLLEIPWMIRNNIAPSLGFNLSPPPFAADPGKKWTYSILRQEYVQVPKTWEMLPSAMRQQVDAYRKRFGLER